MELNLISSNPGQTGAGCRQRGLPFISSGQCDSRNLIFPLKFGLLVSLYLCNKHARFYCEIILIRPVIKIWLFENCRWSRPKNIGAAMSSSPQNLSKAHIGINCLLDWSESKVILYIEQFLIGNGCICDEKGLVISFQLEIFFSNDEPFHIGLRQQLQ